MLEMCQMYLSCFNWQFYIVSKLLRFYKNTELSTLVNLSSQATAVHKILVYYSKNIIWGLLNQICNRVNKVLGIYLEIIFLNI